MAVSYTPDDSFAILDISVTRSLGREQDDCSVNSDTSEGTVVTVICTQLTDYHSIQNKICYK